MSMAVEQTSLGINFLQNFGAMPSLKKIDLSSSGLSGTLPTESFCQLKHLEYLDISENNLKGNLPECFSNLTSLEILDLSSNQFSGNISCLRNLTSLQEFYLSNNNFEIPSSLRPFFNLSKLKCIYADNNTIYAETEMHYFPPRFHFNQISLSC
ncbi:Serine-threonine protein kinase, plant-type, putative [Theobroma cacao]|uniref:Serine-threonine protein kinase, plant-type, putative n=1 Tax=Theobroma cacao TaxID=3641 RepID=A0A061FSU9_THECC|nr:Serine-threonine protein kinase, plant-type, putative [Theobroma cacao]